MFRRQSDRFEKFLAASGWFLAVLVTFMLVTGCLFLASDPAGVDEMTSIVVAIVSVTAIASAAVIAVVGILVVFGAERARRRDIARRTNPENRSQ